MQFHIIKRVSSRRTQYNKSDIIKALDRLNLPYTESRMIVTTTVTTLQERKDLEYQLRLIHRNVAYRIDP